MYMPIVLKTNVIKIKCLGRRVFTIRLINAYLPFQNNMHRRTKSLQNWVILSDFLFFSWIFKKFNVGKTCVEFRGFRDLVTAAGEPIRAGTLLTIAKRSLHQSKSSLSEHAIIELMYTIKVRYGT